MYAVALKLAQDLEGNIDHGHRRPAALPSCPWNGSRDLLEGEVPLRWCPGPGRNTWEFDRNCFLWAPNPPCCKETMEALGTSWRNSFVECGLPTACRVWMVLKMRCCTRMLGMMFRCLCFVEPMALVYIHGLLHSICGFDHCKTSRAARHPVPPTSVIQKNSEGLAADFSCPVILQGLDEPFPQGDRGESSRESEEERRSRGDRMQRLRLTLRINLLHVEQN